MELTLQISGDTLSEEQLHSLTLELAQTIASETDICAQIPEHPPAPEAKGDPITVGTLVLAFFSSGAAVALIGVLKSYFDRASNLTIDIKRPDGHQVNISAQNMKPEQIENTVARLSGLLGN